MPDFPSINDARFLLSTSLAGWAVQVDFHHHGLGATTVGDHLLEVISCHGEIRFRTWEYMLPPPKKIFSEHKNSF
jgi:hypothetical protein